MKIQYEHTELPDRNFSVPFSNQRRTEPLGETVDSKGEAEEGQVESGTPCAMQIVKKKKGFKK